MLDVAFPVLAVDDDRLVGVAVDGERSAHDLRSVVFTLGELLQIGRMNPPIRGAVGRR